MPAPPSLSVVIPVYNSSEILTALHARLTKVLRESGAEYEVVLVDDDSPDASWATLRQLAAQDDRVVAVHLRRNAGYDNALLAGMGKTRHAVVVVMDDDLQHAPEDIPTLVRKLAEGYDVVYAGFRKKQQSALKNLGSWVNGKLAEVVLQKPRGLYLSPFKALRREIAEEIVKYTGPYPYVDGLIFRTTSSFAQVDVVHHPRASGRGHHGFIRSLGILVNFLTTFSLLPLRLATLGGLAISVLALATAFALALARIFLGFGLDAPGWASLVLVTVVLGGLQLMAIGIVGEYVGRSYSNLSGRPQYVIGDVVRGDTTNRASGPSPADRSSVPLPVAPAEHAKSPLTAQRPHIRAS